MNYEVRCECGKTQTVGATEAGNSLPCSCGRTIDVPPLHLLRQSAGQFGMPPDMLLQGMILQKQLPDTDECAACGVKTDGQVVAVINCERAEERTEKATPSGCLPIGLGIIIFYHPARKREQGRDVWFRVPVRCCPKCAQTLTTELLTDMLYRHPVCAGVLDKYPNAHVTLSS